MSDVKIPMADKAEHHQECWWPMGTCSCSLLRERDRLRAEVERLNEYKKKIKALVYEQADDSGLWFVVWGRRHSTAPEKYLQQALRRLHAAIEERGDE